MLIREFASFCYASQLIELGWGSGFKNLFGFMELVWPARNLATGGPFGNGLNRHGTRSTLPSAYMEYRQESLNGSRWETASILAKQNEHQPQTPRRLFNGCLPGAEHERQVPGETDPSS